MKRLTTLLMTLMLMSAALWADEKITVSANSSDISEGLDLKMVAKLFAEAENLEQFEMKLNNPDSAFCNLDLNGDGQVDYLRVVETGEGNKRLIVLQAILAKDIYQDVASIYVVKDEANQVSVQIVGDEYVYGTNYIIEPVYVYRPVIYDWFWGPAWVAWDSPWYWGYYPGWWYVHGCWACDRYWAHCYAFHHAHHYCSFRPGHSVRNGYMEMQSGVSRRDYAAANPNTSFAQRNSGVTNAGQLRNTTGVTSRSASASADRNVATRSAGVSARTASTSERTYGSRTTAAQRAGSDGNRRSSSAVTQRTATAQRSTGSDKSAASSEASRSSSAATSRSTASATRTTSTSRSSSAVSRSTSSTTRSAATSTRSTGAAYSSGAATRTSASSGSSSRSSSYYGGSSASGSSYSGGGSVSRGSSYSGGGGATRSSGGSVRR